MNVPTIKVEQSDVLVKPEPGSLPTSPVGFSDEDIYEDAGDVDFSHVDRDVYLMRLPDWVWANWANIDDDEQIQLGTVRVEDLGLDPKGSKGEHKQKMTLLLSNSTPYNEGLPQEYSMQVTNNHPSNLFIFSEKDLPGYKSHKPIKEGDGTEPGDVKDVKDVKLGSNAAHTGPSRTGASRAGRGPHEATAGSKRWQPYVRKAIPKQISLAAAVKREINCLPIENAEYARIMASRAAQAAKLLPETRFLKGLSSTRVNLLAPGTLEASAGFGSFIRLGATQRPKGPDLKAARIPQNELLDLIYDCFRRYSYWSMKALKIELRQPEAYLKSTLEMVAELVKSGRFAMTWTLKPENKIDQYATKVEGSDEAAPDVGFGMDGASDAPDGNDDGDGIGTGDDDEDDGDDDEGFEMQDVPPA
ncbi:MAG: hypothetical protein M1826_006859 [Phylliscum demangeonii]|nr:MAG: hypothetical protein M1826_006859 [Phylliscum demangeonii]